MNIFRCDHCGHLVSFESSECVRCGYRLAYLPDVGQIGSLESLADGQWYAPAANGAGTEYRLCANYSVYDVCNWAVNASDGTDLCLSCRLTRVIPDLDVAGHRRAWYRLEVAKRRLLYTLLELRLPVVDRQTDPCRGLAFELVADVAGPHHPRVMTGHCGGVITINIAEADDAERERRRIALHEPYRTLLGHFRHEIGHYYWDRLIKDSDRLEAFRALFGDERQDYAEASRALRPGAAGGLARPVRQRLRHHAPVGRLGRDVGALPAHHRHARNCGDCGISLPSAARRRARGHAAADRGGIARRVRSIGSSRAGFR